MTQEEEIRILQTAFEILDRMVKWYHGTSHDFKIGENDIKALEVAKIAIEAMQTEPCEDCISRQAAIEQSIVLRDISNPDKEWEVVTVATIKHLKSVQPEQSTGKWEYLCYQNMKCSKCGYVIAEEDVVEFRFCPKCGDKKQESEDKEEKNPYEKCKTCGQNRESCCGCPEVLELERKKRRASE